MYEIGRIYIWQGQVGEFACLNGSETTVTGPVHVYASQLDGATKWGWPTDTPPPPGKEWVTMAEAGDLRPKNPPPSGERSITDLFRVPELEPA